MSALICNKEILKVVFPFKNVERSKKTEGRQQMVAKFLKAPKAVRSKKKVGDTNL